MAFLRIMAEKPVPTAFYNNSANKQRYISCQDFMDMLEIIRWHDPRTFTADEYKKLCRELAEYDIPVCETELTYALNELGYMIQDNQ